MRKQQLKKLNENLAIKEDGMINEQKKLVIDIDRM